MGSTTITRLSEDPWLAYNVLTLVFPHLDVPDLLRCSQVCKLWSEIVQDPKFWHSVTLKDSKLDFAKMTEHLQRLNTVHLKITNCQMSYQKTPKRLDTLKTLEISDCSSRLLDTWIHDHPELRSLKTRIICGVNPLKFSSLSGMLSLKSVMLYCNRNLENSIGFGNLKELYLLGVPNLNYELFGSVQKNSTLEVLGLGNCYGLNSQWVPFFEALKDLRKLRLENCSDGEIQTICQCINEKKSVKSLELVGLHVRRHFLDIVCHCTNLEELTVVCNPSRFDMGTINSDIFLKLILFGNYRLKKLTWGFSDRYMEAVKESDCIPFSDPDLGLYMVPFGTVESTLKNHMKHIELAVTRINTSVF